MAADDQRKVRDFLADPATYRTAEAVERIDTHISHLFLTGERGFKLKRALHLPYLDFSTPARRLAVCETEVTLNRRTAPELYVGVRKITAGATGPEFDGAGALLDAVVEMRRFDQEALFDAMARRGTLTARHIDALARQIAAVHATAPVASGADGAGRIARVLELNAASFRQAKAFSQDAIARLEANFARALDIHADRLDARAQAGHVRRCHGDLHLRNICLIDGRVRLFDCLEFNEALATIDVLYDLAFLAMDLWHRGLCVGAAQVVNRYCDLSGQEDGYVLMPFFMALRAAVRAHVTATQAEADDSGGTARADEARAYFDLAERLLAPEPARLAALGGLSGSGKSTLATALAPHLGAPPGARVIGSDRTRKALFDTPPDQPLPAEAYTPEVSARVYAEIARRATALLADGVAVIADAVHDRPEDRTRIEGVARAGAVPFHGVWLQADPGKLRSRLQVRDAGASDADDAVLTDQLARAPDPTGWTVVSTEGEIADSLTAVLSHIEP